MPSRCRATIPFREISRCVRIHLPFSGARLSTPRAFHSPTQAPTSIPSFCALPLIEPEHFTMYRPSSVWQHKSMHIWFSSCILHNHINSCILSPWAINSESNHLSVKLSLVTPVFYNWDKTKKTIKYIKHSYCGLSLVVGDELWIFWHYELINYDFKL